MIIAEFIKCQITHLLQGNFFPTHVYLLDTFVNNHTQIV